MRIRLMDDNGDMQFGQSLSDFTTNTPTGVAQLVGTRLKLWSGEFFADTSDGMPWATDVLGNRTTSIYNTSIRDRILSTQGVYEITKYSSSLLNRKLTVTATLTTDYGATTVTFGGT